MGGRSVSTSEVRGRQVKRGGFRRRQRCSAWSVQGGGGRDWRVLLVLGILLLDPPWHQRGLVRLSSAIRSFRMMSSMRWRAFFEALTAVLEQPHALLIAAVHHLFQRHAVGLHRTHDLLQALHGLFKGGFGWGGGTHGRAGIRARIIRSAAVVASRKTSVLPPALKSDGSHL
jgi:hypothetical protein